MTDAIHPRRAAGLVVSALGLGAGGIGEDRLSDSDADRVLCEAVDLGITFVDTARSYGASEARIGRWLAASPSRRARIVLSTKTGYGASGVADWTAECVTRGIDEALARMHTDVIDVVHLHSCGREVLERGDVVAALERARDAGKIRVAAYSGENDALEWAVASSRFGAVQCSVNVFDQRSLAGAIAKAHGADTLVIAKRALGNAPWRFAERPHGHYSEPYWERMRKMGIDLGGLPWSELAIRFAAFAPGVSTALIGTTDTRHLRANAEAVQRGPLPAASFDAVRAAFAANDDGWIGQI